MNRYVRIQEKKGCKSRPSFVYKSQIVRLVLFQRRYETLGELHKHPDVRSAAMIAYVHFVPRACLLKVLFRLPTYDDKQVLSCIPLR